MADRTVGELPRAPGLYDDSLLVIEQQGAARSLAGAQLKDYAREGVSEYVEDAKRAAETAQEAVKGIGDSVERAETAREGAEAAQKAIEDLEVTADTLPAGTPASVEKTAREGHVLLAFGIPQGRQGETGPQGPAGPEGPRGPQGAGLMILGRYETPEELAAAVPAPEPGAAYNVGSEPPYHLYTWDEEHREWVDNGVLQGPPGETGPQGPPGPAGPTGAAGGVTSFNNRTGDVNPASGDYTAEMVGAADKTYVDEAIRRAVLASWEGSY